MERPEEIAPQHFGARARVRYRERARRFGASFAAVEYSLREGQRCRFEATLRLLRFAGWPEAGLRVLDVGCGLGDFLDFLREHSVRVARYVGIDVAPEMIEHARSLHPSAEFRCASVFDVRERFDAAVAIGAFSVRETDEAANRRLVVDTFERMQSVSRRCACISLLSDRKHTIREDEYVVDPWALASEIQARVDGRLVVDHQEMPHEVFYAVFPGPSPWKRAWDAHIESPPT